MMQPDNDRTLRALLGACGDFSIAALMAIGPTLGARIIACRHYVCVRCQPARARLVVQTEDGATTAAYQAEGAEFPAELGTATAAFITAALAQLDAGVQSTLARLTAADRVALGVLVERDSGACHLVVDVGDELPHIVCTLRPDLVAH